MNRRWIWSVAFALYGALMLWLLFDRVGYDPGVPYPEQLKFNLVPLHTIRLFWDALQSHTYRTAAVVNLGGNVIMFIPLGFLLPRVFPRLEKWWKVLAAAIGIVTAVELVQLVTLLGTCDIDDLILNLLGAIMGYSIHSLLTKKSLSK